MDIQFGDSRFWTIRFDNSSDGLVGLRLQRERLGKTATAAEIIYWDAVGGFTVETKDGDVPVEVVEALISEAKTAIRIR